MPVRRTIAVFVIALLGGACHRAPPEVAPVPGAFSDSVAAGSPRREGVREPHAPPPAYVELPYGSDAQFNPLTVVLNEGYDMMRLDRSRAVFELPYRDAATGVWHSLLHPEAVIRHYGWGRWARTEVFPLSLRGQGGAQWVPNYHLHLFGAGMTYARMADWYEAEGVPHPRIASALTLYAGHFLNEVIENIGNRTGEDEDGLTDLAIFDPLGMLLWNQDFMRRRFSGSVEMNNWYGQPTLSFPDRRLENAFSAFMLRVPMPRTRDWKIITTGGNTFLLGMSRRVSDSLWFSVTGGAIPSAVPIIDPRTNTRTAELKPNVGVFIDRNGSLLASFLGLAGQTNGPTLNVYPGALHVGPFSPGLWMQAVRGGYDVRGVRWGITTRLGIGAGGVAK